MTLTMTIKEISKTSGCSARTVGKYANKLFPLKNRGRGFTRTYSQPEATTIMESIPKKNMVSSENVKSDIPECQNDHSTEKMIETLIDGFGKTIEKIIENQNIFMKEVLFEIRGNEKVPGRLITENQKVLPITKSRRSELVQIVRQKAYNLNMPHAEAWNRLYDEIKYSWPLRMDIKARAKNKNMTTLDFAEKENLIPQLIEYAKEI